MLSMEIQILTPMAQMIPGADLHIPNVCVLLFFQGPTAVKRTGQNGILQVVIYKRRVILKSFVIKQHVIQGASTRQSRSADRQICQAIDYRHHTDDAASGIVREVLTR
jgi:hypothetical protein